MPDNDPTTQMEVDIASIAKRLAPDRPTVVASGLPSPVASIGAAAVSKRLESLLKRCQDLNKQAEVVATALAGITNYAGNPAPRGTLPPEHLFGKQMLALDEIAAVLDSIGRQIERAQRSLA